MVQNFVFFKIMSFFDLRPSLEPKFRADFKKIDEKSRKINKWT